MQLRLRLLENLSHTKLGGDFVALGAELWLLYVQGDVCFVLREHKLLAIAFGCSLSCIFSSSPLHLYLDAPAQQHSTTSKSVEPRDLSCLDHPLLTYSTVLSLNFLRYSFRNVDGFN